MDSEVSFIITLHRPTCKVAYTTWINCYIRTALGSTSCDGRTRKGVGMSSDGNIAERTSWILFDEKI